MFTFTLEYISQSYSSSQWLAASCKHWRVVGGPGWVIEQKMYVNPFPGKWAQLHSNGEQCHKRPACIMPAWIKAPLGCFNVTTQAHVLHISGASWPLCFLSNILIGELSTLQLPKRAQRILLRHLASMRAQVQRALASDQASNVVGVSNISHICSHYGYQQHAMK